MPGIAFLHTAESHVATFSDLMERLAPEFGAHHLVDASLLADAVAAGQVTEEIARRTEVRLEEAATSGAGLVVCTCSTIGDIAERIGQATGLPVLRIDRAMAERAVDTATRILVAACVVTTVGPTTELLQAVAEGREKSPEIETVVIEGAWSSFVAGDLDDYYTAIAEGLRQGLGDAEVVVLAQASMAPAVERCRDLDVPILSSPEMGVRHALQLMSAG